MSAATPKKKKLPLLQRNIRANMASKLNSYINKLKYDDDYKKYSKGKLLDAIKGKVNTLRNSVLFENRSGIMKLYNYYVQQKYPRKEGENAKKYYNRIKKEGAMYTLQLVLQIIELYFVSTILKKLMKVILIYFVVFTVIIIHLISQNIKIKMNILKNT